MERKYIKYTELVNRPNSKSNKYSNERLNNAA